MITFIFLTHVAFYFVKTVEAVAFLEKVKVKEKKGENHKREKEDLIASLASFMKKWVTQLMCS